MAILRRHGHDWREWKKWCDQCWIPFVIALKPKPLVYFSETAKCPHCGLRQEVILTVDPNADLPRHLWGKVLCPLNASHADRLGDNKVDGTLPGTLFYIGQRVVVAYEYEYNGKTGTIARLHMPVDEAAKQGQKYIFAIKLDEKTRRGESEITINEYWLRSIENEIGVGTG